MKITQLELISTHSSTKNALSKVEIFSIFYFKSVVTDMGETKVYCKHRLSFSRHKLGIINKAFCFCILGFIYPFFVTRAFLYSAYSNALLLLHIKH